jgi:hypothetical protein
MHESIAKAEIKGTFRKVNSELDHFNEDVMGGAKKRISKKGVQSYVNRIISIYGNLLLVHERESKSSSWHFKSTIFAINPDHEKVQNIGELHPFVVEHFDSKLFMKRKLGLHMYFEAPCYVHKHFLQRIKQRVEHSQNEHLGQLLCSLVLWLADCKSLVGVDASEFHVVTRHEILILTYHRDIEKYVFNTVLLRERFSPVQSAHYEQYFEKLRYSEFDFIVMNLDTHESSFGKLDNVDLIQKVLQRTSFFERSF